MQDPFAQYVVQDDPFAQFAQAATLPEPPSAGGATAAVTGLRAAPSIVRAAGRLVASHPAAAQKAIGAGISTAAGGAGAAIGGVPGAVVGASIRGVTPAQTTIRQMAGRVAGESPAVAGEAAKALGIQNYAKELTGTKLTPADIIPKPNAANAVEHYANSMEKGILRLYGPHGEVVSGPSAVSRLPTKPVAGRLMKVASKAGKVLGPLSAATGVTDFAQAVEPNRHDIGVMGIGLDGERPEAEREAHPALLNDLAQRLLALIGSGER